MKMLVGSHQGSDADGGRERHNTQSSGDARCHDRQTATEVRWVSLLSGKKWRGKGWLRRGEASGKCCKGTMRTLGWASLAHCSKAQLWEMFLCIKKMSFPVRIVLFFTFLSHSNGGVLTVFAFRHAFAVSTMTCFFQVAIFSPCCDLISVAWEQRLVASS